MGRSMGKQLHLAKINLNTNTPNEFLEALAKSPYSEHRKMAIRLKPVFEKMSIDAITKLKEQEESNAFKKSLEL